VRFRPQASRPQASRPQASGTAHRFDVHRTGNAVGRIERRCRQSDPRSINQAVLDVGHCRAPPPADYRPCLDDSVGPNSAPLADLLLSLLSDHHESRMALEEAITILGVLTSIAKAVPVLGAPVEGAIEALSKILELAKARRLVTNLPSCSFNDSTYREPSRTEHKRRSSQFKLLAG
jgi:hypothetical protein